MTIGVFEIHPAAAVVAVDLARLALARVGPVFEPSLANAAEDLVEFFFTNQESVVPRRDLAINLVELEGNAVAEFNDEEQSKGVWVAGRGLPSRTSPISACRGTR